MLMSKNFSLRAPALAAFVAIACAGYAAARGADGQSAPRKSAKELYAAACSTCHGADGRGASREHVGFDQPLPDFTDCNFTSREQKADWFAIAHQGGPVRGFSRLMPAFGDALAADELELAVAHVRSFCTDRHWPPGELNLPRPLVTEKAFPEDEAVYSTAVSAEGPGAVSNKIIYEKRFGARNQFELTAPFGWRKTESAGAPLDGAGAWLGGLGDVAVGAKRVLVHNARSIFSLTGEIVLPTGDSEKGFGKGTTILEPFVSFGQVLPSEFFFQSQAGVEFPTDTERAQREGFWRFTLGRSFASARGFGRRWFPMLEFLGARELVADEKSQWDVVPQMQVTLSSRQHVRVNLGVRLPLTDRGPRATQILFYLLWDWFDGRFFQGW